VDLLAEKERELQSLDHQHHSNSKDYEMNYKSTLITAMAQTFYNVFEFV